MVRAYVYAEVDLDEFSTTELIEELRIRRGGHAEEDPKELLHEAYEAAERGDLDRVLWCLRCHLFPKFKTVDSCVNALKTKAEAA